MNKRASRWIKPKLAAIGVAGLISALSASACVNYIGTNAKGEKFSAESHIGEDLKERFVSRMQRNVSVNYRNRVINQIKEEPGFRTANNLAALLIDQGKLTPAIRFLLKIERQFPGHAETAANLGTALELVGADEIALKWIELGIKRNPDEHNGTEWLHREILKYKIMLAKGGKGIPKSLAGVQFGDQLVPAMPLDLPKGNTGTPIKPHDLNRAFFYQLFERVGFVKPPDVVCGGQLVSRLGNAQLDCGTN